MRPQAGLETLRSPEPPPLGPPLSVLRLPPVQVDESDRAIIRAIGEYGVVNKGPIFDAQIGTVLWSVGLPAGEDPRLRDERLTDLAKRGLVKRVPVPAGHARHDDAAFYVLTLAGQAVFDEGGKR
jgi:hypothetical protein